MWTQRGAGRPGSRRRDGLAASTLKPCGIKAFDEVTAQTESIAAGELVLTLCV
jgi:hypothetical protein